MKPPLLFISQQLPYPLTDGGNVRTFKILEALASRYAVTLVACLRKDANRQKDKQKALDAISPLLREIICVEDVKSQNPFFLLRVIARALLKGLPFSISYNFNPHIARAVSGQLRTGKFRFVHCNHLDAVQHLTPGLSGFRKTLDTHNLLYELYEKAAHFENSGFKRWLKRFEAVRLRTYEKKTFSKMDSLLVCSRREAELAGGWGYAKRLQVIPNGVDCDFFVPPPKNYTDNPPVLVFTGAMGYGPNADAALHFIRDTMPLLRPRVPGVRFLVVGKNPTAELLISAKDNSDVTVTGMVEDVREYVYGARIFVVPIRMGAGTRLKVLEAFALGIPAVSTPVGAEGIAYEDERHLLIAESAQDMADAVCRLLNQTDLYLNMATEARALAVARYDWKAVGATLLEAYEAKEAQP